jgi:hypothetical protein
MDPLSIAGTVVAAAELADEVQRSLRQYTNTAKYTPKVLEVTLKEITAIAAALDGLSQWLQEPSHAHYLLNRDLEGIGDRLKTTMGVMSKILHETNLDLKLRELCVHLSRKRTELEQYLQTSCVISANNQDFPR